MQSSSPASAACAAPWLGGAAGQPGANLLRQPREQDHTVAQTHHPVIITSLSTHTHMHTQAHCSM